LNPEWNGLVWSEDFPEWLERLFWGGTRVGDRDRRVLDAAQIAPLRVTVVRRAVMTPEESGGMELLVWGSVVLLFIFERVLSHGKAKN
jgi:hypothetical protein